jgi:glycosyltransferase involved in cell wall biosynthesis
MKKVLLRGPALSRSGYGEHTRQVFQYLSTIPGIELKVQVLPWGITPWHVNHDSCNGLIGQIVRASEVRPNDKFDVSVQVQLPNEWDASLATKNIGITAAVETDIANPTWTSVHCEKMDHVIVPSKHAMNSLLQGAGTRTPIEVIGESYFDELLQEPDELELGITTDFNLLTVGVLTGLSPETDRKNLFYLIKWFVEEFRKDKNVGLIVKTSQGRETSMDRKSTESMLKKLLREIGHDGTPKIYLLHGELSRQEMNSLYKHPKVQGFVSATRGEGFGLPFLEAAVAGLPVLATNWSAHTEFLDYGFWIKFEHELKRVDQSKIDKNIFMPNAKWAEVKEREFKASIRKFYNSHSMPKQKAKELSAKLSKLYSQETINSQYEEKIGKYFR